MARVAKGLVVGDDGVVRCWWGASARDYAAYHDEEWGLPVHDDVRLFEKICLEGFQSGLSWLTILRKRENFRKAFAGFDYHRVARFNRRSVERLLKDAGIVRHRGKIESTINNAKRAIELEEEFGSLSAFFWEHAPPASERPRRMTHGAPDEALQDARINGAEQGPQRPRLVFRGAYDRLCLHAGHGTGERPFGGLLRPRTHRKDPPCLSSPTSSTETKFNAG